MDAKIDADKLQGLTNRVEIEELTLRYGQYADQRDWETLISLFIEEIHLDYTSLAGGDPARIEARKLVEEQWAPALGALDATQHFVGPSTIILDGDRTTARAYFQAQHVLSGATGGDKWTLGGRYDFVLVRTSDGWKISGVTMTAVWEDGNRDLMAQATARTQGPPASEL